MGQALRIVNVGAAGADNKNGFTEEEIQIARQRQKLRDQEIRSAAITRIIVGHGHQVDDLQWQSQVLRNTVLNLRLGVYTLSALLVVSLAWGATHGC